MNKIIIMVLFILVSFTWGTTWIAMKMAIETIPPFFATGMRFLLASPILIVLSYLTKSPILFPPGKRWFQIFIAIFYFAIPFTLMLYGSSFVSPLISSIIFANMPVAVLIVSVLYFKKKISSMQKIGIVISLITLFFVLFIELKSNFFNPWKGILCFLLALFSHAIIYAQCEKKCYNISVLTFNSLPSLISGILLSSIAYFIEYPNIYNFSNKSIISILYLANFSGIFGILSYFYLQKKVEVFYASIIFLIFPFISGFFEYYFYQHKISIFEIWSIFPLFLGILLTLIPLKK